VYRVLLVMLSNILDYQRMLISRLISTMPISREVRYPFRMGVRAAATTAGALAVSLAVDPVGAVDQHRAPIALTAS
jgi:hypothetical protein